MRTVFDSGDIKKFWDDLDSVSSATGDFDIRDFYVIMVEAVRRDDVQFTKELLDRGLPMDPLYASQTIRVKAKKNFERFYIKRVEY